MLYLAMAEFAQLKVELAKSVESHTGTQSEQKDLTFRSSQLVMKWKSFWIYCKQLVRMCSKRFFWGEGLGVVLGSLQYQYGIRKPKMSAKNNLFNTTRLSKKITCEKPQESYNRAFKQIYHRKPTCAFKDFQKISKRSGLFQYGAQRTVGLPVV